MSRGSEVPSRRSRPLAIAATCLVAVGMAVAAPSCTKPSAREASIARTRAALEAELERSGAGTWKAWWQRLEPARDVYRAMTRGQGRPSRGFAINPGAVEYLADADLEDGVDGTRPLDVLVALHRFLQAKGTDFIYVPIPTIEEVYPDNYLDTPPPDGIVQPLGREFLHSLLARDVEVIDLLPVFMQGGEGYRLGLKKDDHWNNVQIELAAEHVATRLADYAFAKAAAPRASQYRTTPVTIDGERGISEMRQVTSPDGRLFEPSEQSPVLVVGDSNLQVYEYSLADLPNAGQHAGFSAHLSRALGLDVSLLAVSGFRPQALNRVPRRLEGRQVVVYVGSVTMLSRQQWLPLSVE